MNNQASPVQDSLRKHQAKNQPKDIMSIWIKNPCLKHLTQNILQYLNAKSLANCKLVSSTFWKYINSERKLMIHPIQHIFHYVNFKQIRIDPKTKLERLLTNFEATDFSEFLDDDEFESEEEVKSCWKSFLELIKTEMNIAIVQKILSLCRIDLLFINDARVICLTHGMSKMFRKLIEKHPLIETDHWTFDVKLGTWATIGNSEGLFEVIKHYKDQNIRFKDNEQVSGILFTLYEEIPEDRDNLKKLELLFEHSEALGINVNAPNEDGQTLKEIATMNDDSDILDLFKRYSKVSKKRKIANFS